MTVVASTGLGIGCIWLSSANTKPGRSVNITVNIPTIVACLITIPPNISVSINQATGIVTLTPDPDFNGVNFINFTANDGTNTTLSNQVNLTVLNTNDAPIITTFSPTKNKTIASSVGSQRFEITFADIDIGDYVNATWFRNTTDNIALKIATNSSNVTVTNLDGGFYNITVIVNDTAGAEARNEWVLTVTTEIVSDELTSPVLSLNESERQNATDVVVNQSTFGSIGYTNKTLYFSGVVNLEDAINISRGFISVNTETFPELNKNASIIIKGLNFTKAPLIFTAPRFESKSNNVTCPDNVCTNITYDIANGILRFNVTQFSTYFAQTNTTNGAPVITSAPITSATDTTKYSYNVEATDPDGDPLLFSLIVKPPGMSISSSGLISWTPDSSHLGGNNVTVNVSDSNLTILH
ncbi:MAG: putative Ig domain-containing protein, partial [Candidatus Dadabacteria bacterium]|nr:putative Ig domain-containing protein [Candidatus Dadabacteria bacterium]